MWKGLYYSQKLICVASLVLMLALTAGVVNGDIRSGLVGYYSLDEVKIYDIVLSAEEVMQLAAQ